MRKVREREREQIGAVVKALPWDHNPKRREFKSWLYLGLAVTNYEFLAQLQEKCQMHTASLPKPLHGILVRQIRGCHCDND